MSREQTKAAHYIQQLDEARCHGNWDAVPELVRKVKKHAPNRTCLALTAESEHAIHEASLHRSHASRPGTADTARPATASSSGNSNLSQYIPFLLEAIEKERSFVEDCFQAEVCLGWLHWSLDETALAILRLPKSIEAEFSQLNGTNKESAGWTRICALKASYIKGTAQVRTGSVAEALETYKSALPILSTTTSGAQGKELCSWTELFLTGLCMLSSNAIKSKITSILEAETLTAFRAWGKFWETQNNVPQGGRALEADVPRRRVWKEYYITLSDLLQQELPFPTTSLTTAYAETSARLQQRAELKRVETRYETLLLNEVQFPKAQQASEEVEAFVEMAMENWRILCGSKWKEHDLGEGGSEAVSRGVLDILYRAATKTFHSTAILRHLFTVHLAIAEFELALKAFDTYLEIVNKGKARVEKTGEAEHGLDDDETVMRTVSECIRALCRYGTRQGTEKAKELGQYLEKWLDVHYPSHGSNGLSLENEHSTNQRAALSLPVLAMTWRSIGICHAQWARFTYDGPSRTDIQLKAIKCFKKALSPEYRCSTDVETLFALGTLLAERRELGAAIEVVKIGLMPQRLSATKVPLGSGPHPGHFVRERRLIPLWHLMALLLSARQEFVTAARSCEGAFEQFQDPKFLFGEEDPGNSFRSDHLNEKAAPRSAGIVDDMDDFEKEGVLQVKMTQLALIEVLEGPEIAVNASDELLGLYARLFGDPQKDTIPAVTPRTAIPPKSAAGTVRSIRGSIFGRTGRSLRKANPAGPTINENNENASLARPQTTQTVASTIAPTIQVTSDTGSRRRSNSVKAPHHHEKLQKRSDSASRKKAASQRNRSSSTGTSRFRNSAATNGSSKPIGVDGESYYPPGDSQNQDSLNHERSEIGLAITPNSSKPLPPNSQQMTHQEASLKPAHSIPATNQSNRLPNVSSNSSSPAPVTRFPKEQEGRRRTTILIRVWLLISGFYRRALMFEDAKGAVEEAEKLLHALQEAISRDPNGNVTLQSPGWGGGESVSELWGDVFSERGSLAVAETSPYVALDHFESALTNFADHCSATVGLSNLLLDIYTEKLQPPPAIPPLSQTADHQSTSTLTNLVGSMSLKTANQTPQSITQSRLGPLGVTSTKIISPSHLPQTSASSSDVSSEAPSSKELPTVFLDRLAARDRAYGLLSGLTKLGSGWNYSEAWFALARAYEEGGQLDKAREVLWWCVELEESRGVRDWTVVGSGGYVL